MEQLPLKLNEHTQQFYGTQVLQIINISSLREVNRFYYVRVVTVFGTQRRDGKGIDLLIQFKCSQLLQKLGRRN